MTDIKTALQAEIEKMEAACDEIPFGLDEEDEQCLSVMRGALKELVQRDAQIAALTADANALRVEGVEQLAELMRSYIGKPNKNDAAASYCAREAIVFAKKLREGKVQ